MDKAALPEPRRVLQIYDADQQRQFDHMTAKDRLAWLEAINELYWSVLLRRQHAPQKKF